MTEYTQNNGNYFDEPDFRPYLVSFPVPEGTAVKGTVLICAGGAFQFLANADVVEAAGVPVERLQLDGMPHGFGFRGDWIPAYDQWLSGIFQA